MKKIASLLISLTLMAMLCVTAFAASGKVTATANSNSIHLGDTVTVTVKGSGIGLATSMGLTIKYDTAVFEFVKGSGKWLPANGLLKNVDESIPGDIFGSLAFGDIGGSSVDTNLFQFQLKAKALANNSPVSVTPVVKNGTRTISAEASTVKYSVQLATPVVTAAKMNATGVNVTWNAVAGAENYRVLYKASGASAWTKCAETSDTSYQVTGLTSGTAYTFTVQCFSADGKTETSAYEAGKTLTYIAAPVITKLTNVANGVTVQWSKSTGAVNYRVFYKEVGAAKFTKFGDTTGTSMTVTGLKGGASYVFTVQCLNAKGTSYTSSYIVSDSHTYLTAPVVTAAKMNAVGVAVTWNAVAGAENYRVYYKADGAKSWTNAGDTTATSMVVTGLTSGTKYTFVVRCMNAEGTAYASAYNAAGKVVTYIAAPTITSLTPTTTGVTVKWAKSAGAVNYRLFYKEAGAAKFTKVGDTTGTSKSVTGLKSGTEYVFTVQCISKDGKSYTSSYKAGTSIVYLSAPVVTAAKMTATGVTVTWQAVAGAENYRVYYKANGAKGWTNAGDTTATNKVVTGLKSGTTYTFVVRCMNAEGTAYTSAYNTAGKVVNYIAAPTITSVTNTASGVVVKWEAPVGAVNYRVFYKVAGAAKFTKVGDTTGTSKTVTGLTSGEEYVFTVQCLSANGKSYTSSYDPNGMSIVKD